MNNQYNPDGFIPKHGGYKLLLSYQKAEAIYDGTCYFCKKYFHPFDRTIDQMVQAARSGKQNIVEGSMASGTSKKMEIKSLEDEFLHNGGLRERMSQARMEVIKKRLSKSFGK